MFSVMVRLHVLGMELFGHLLCPAAYTAVLLLQLVYTYRSNVFSLFSQCICE